VTDAERDFDLRRLRELPTLLGAELPAIIATLVSELNRAADQLQTAIASGDWDAAEQAAHAGRNSALMLNARPLLGAFSQAEQAARRADPSAARAAHARVERVWPALRAQLQAEAESPR
jgi:HPt (histidine-containing phosphotransfer) domain-containing protein